MISIGIAIVQPDDSDDGTYASEAIALYDAIVKRFPLVITLTGSIVVGGASLAAEILLIELPDGDTANQSWIASEVASRRRLSTKVIGIPFDELTP
jgi:hypothetical protein